MGGFQSKSFYWAMLIILGSVSILACDGFRKSDVSEIEIKLIMKEKFNISDPIPADIVVKGKPKERVFISHGFNDLFDKEHFDDKKKSRYLFQEMRTTDPEGRLLVARQHRTHYEFPDAPPARLELVEKKIIHPVECEEIGLKLDQPIREEDLREYYDFSIPGNYKAQVQLSVMTFKEQPCSLENGKLVLLTSNPVNFTIEYPKSEKSFFKSQKVTQTNQKDNPAKPGILLAESMNDSSSDLISPLNWTGSLEASTLIAPVAAVTPVRSQGGNPAARPKAVLLMPAQAANVDIKTQVKVEMQSMTKDIAVVMKVLGLEVYNSDYPDICQDRTKNPPVNCTQRTPPDPGAASYTLTYDPTIDPRIDFMPSQKIDIAVTNTNKKKPNSGSYTDSFSFETAAASNEPDLDEDGIPDSMEGKLGTDKSKKTLFIRPKKIDGAQFVYWEGFKSLFPSTKPGFAEISAFDTQTVKFEISVIGAPDHPNAKMQQFNYDPALDEDHPPCDILELIYMPPDAYCTFGHYNSGHTHFYTAGASWYWDTKGYVPNNQTTEHFQKYRYFTPLVYPLPVETYFTEGAYPSIEDGAGPAVTSGCGLPQCYDWNHASPLNLNDAETGPPFTQRPDLTVEFNAIVFDTDKRIITIGARGEGYYRDEVLQRTIVHELGHALLAASENDHCANQYCIMWSNVLDWKMRKFGGVQNEQDSPPPGICEHSPGGSKDIRARGIVHNRVH